MLFRILTEDVNDANVARDVSKSFPGFTLTHGTGYWQGNPEPSTIVDIDAPAIEARIVQQVAEEIRRDNHQQVVLVEEIPSNAVMVDGTQHDLAGDPLMLGDSIPV